jgi:hypothetical protein
MHNMASILYTCRSTVFTRRLYAVAVTVQRYCMGVALPMDTQILSVIVFFLFYYVISIHLGYDVMN